MAHAWKACWVNALGGSNPPSSAGRRARDLQRCGLRALRRRRVWVGDGGGGSSSGSSYSPTPSSASPSRGCSTPSSEAAARCCRKRPTAASATRRRFSKVGSRRRREKGSGGMSGSSVPPKRSSTASTPRSMSIVPASRSPSDRQLRLPSLARRVGTKNARNSSSVHGPGPSRTSHRRSWMAPAGARRPKPHTRRRTESEVPLSG